MIQIHAELRGLYTADLPCDDLEHCAPADPTNCGFVVTAAIGPKDAEGVEVFDFFVCTPRWLADNIPAHGYEWGRHKLILPHWDYDALLRALTDLCAEATGPSWESVATRLARYGAWEFEDDQPAAAGPKASRHETRAGG